MSNRHIAAIAIVSALACAKSAPEVSEQRLQPQPATIAPSATAPSAAPSATATGAAPADPHAALPKVSVDEVAALLDAKKAQAVDANGADTRKQLGTLPGAVLLTNYKSFDVSELPADKSKELVFYCGGETCSAAPTAAKRAREAGYSDVKVMAAGISGWVKANKPVDKPGV